jgi:hypothetical protein
MWCAACFRSAESPYVPHRLSLALDAPRILRVAVSASRGTIMPKATLTIGGPINATGLSLLAAAMADDGLPLRDADDEEGPAQQPTLTDNGTPDPGFYRQAIIDAHAANEPVALGTWEDAADLTEVGKHTLRCADQLALTVRIHQTGGFDPAYGENREAYIAFSGALAPVRGSAWICADGDPVIPIARSDIASPEAFAARFHDAQRSWAIVDAKVPPIDIL